MFWVLPYLKCLLKKELLLKKTRLDTLMDFTNFNWVQSTSSYLIYFGPNLIVWISKKQHTVARSSIESEFKVIANAFVEFQWLRKLFLGSGVQLKNQPL